MFNNLLKRSQKHIFAIYCKVRRIHVESSLVVKVHMFTIHCIIQKNACSQFTEKFKRRRVYQFIVKIFTVQPV